MVGTKGMAGDPAAPRILEAAERLFAARGFDGVSVREIADAAGVTHPLIYYHWGSKRGLLAAVLERSQERVRSVAAGQTDVRDVIMAIIRDHLDDGRFYLLTMARGFLGGMPVDDWPGGYPGMTAAISAMLDAGPADDPRWDEEARGVVALVTAMLLGWVLMGEPIMDVAGITPPHREAAHERLLAAIDGIVREALEARSMTGEAD